MLVWNAAMHDGAVHPAISGKPRVKIQHVGPSASHDVAPALLAALRVWSLILTFQGIPVIPVSFPILEFLENYFLPLKSRYTGRMH